MKHSLSNILLKKLNSKKLILSVVGMGYVGLPLALLFGGKFVTYGIDFSAKKIKNLKKKIDINKQCEREDFKKSKYIKFTVNYNVIKKSDVIIVCLPTPINKKKKPDLEILKNATYKISENLKKNSIIIYESTVYPGVVEDICAQIIQKKSKYIWKKDFFLGYSPERVNPNDKLHTIENIDKLVSADTPETLKIIYRLYKNIIKKKVIKSSSIKVAETAKVIENTQRDINIALMNELSIICQKLNINTKQVIDAASTKWNFIKFTPGLVGGHCIGVDPYYLKEKSIKLGYFPKIISCGRELNDKMPKYVFNSIKSKIIKSSKNKTLFVGVTFKEDCNDTRNSKNIELIKLFIKNNYKIDIYDPILKSGTNYSINNIKVQTKKNKLLDYYENIILLVPHNKILVNSKFLINKIPKGGNFFDIKSSINPKILTNKKINYWSL